jgi:hypothetical protein
MPPAVFWLLVVLTIRTGIDSPELGRRVGHGRPGYVFAWDGHYTKAYRIQPEIVRTNRGPMWIATPTAD